MLLRKQQEGFGEYCAASMHHQDTEFPERGGDSANDAYH